MRLCKLSTSRAGQLQDSLFIPSKKKQSASQFGEFDGSWATLAPRSKVRGLVQAPGQTNTQGLDITQEHALLLL